MNYLDTLIWGGARTADGLSYTDYKFLVKELGEKYSERFVSAQNLIADFHGEHVAGEIIEFFKVGDITRKGIERALSNEVVTPGKTTYHDVVWWLEEQNGKRWVCAEPGFQVQHFHKHLVSRGIKPLSYGWDKERVIQRGDILFIDWGLNRNNILHRY